MKAIGVTFLLALTVLFAVLLYASMAGVTYR